MVKMLRKSLPNNVCFYHNNGKCRSLIDTVSISFYKLSDVIAVFDTKRATGVCMEVFMTSSAVKNFTYPEKSMTWRFLFCKYRDNAFSIDGEKIQRPSDISTDDGFTYVERGLAGNTANDEAVNAIKKKTKTAKN
jgi:hypothetical protein